jgi:hypothetical protein
MGEAIQAPDPALAGEFSGSRPPGDGRPKFQFHADRLWAGVGA